MEAGTLVARARSGEREVRDCAFAADGRHVVSMHASGRFTIWRLPTMSQVVAVRAPDLRPDAWNVTWQKKTVAGSWYRHRRFALSADGERLALAGWNAVELWDVEANRVVFNKRFEVGTYTSVLTLAFLSSDTLVALASSDPVKVLIWDLNRPAGAASFTLDGSPAKTERALVTGDGRFVIATSADETIVWQLESASVAAAVRTGAAGQAVAVSSDGSLAATAGVWSADGGAPDLKLWSLPDLSEISSWGLRDLGCRDIACAVAFTPDGRHLVIGGWEGVLRRLALRAQS
jgi:WD40 repeat protein